MTIPLTIDALVLDSRSTDKARVMFEVIDNKNNSNENNEQGTGKSLTKADLFIYLWMAPATYKTFKCITNHIWISNNRGLI